MGDLGPQQLHSRRLGWGSQIVTGAQAAGDVGTNQPAAVGDHGVQLQQLQRREREALPEGGCSRFDRLGEEIIAALELAGYGPGEIRIGDGVNANGMEPAPVHSRLEVVHGVHHANVARHLQHGGEIQHSVGPVVVVEDRPAANRHRAGVIHRGVGINHTLLQGQGQVDRLKGGARFVEVLHRPFAK